MRYFYVFFLICSVVPVISQTPAQHTHPQTNYVPAEILVKFKDAVTIEESKTGGINRTDIATLDSLNDNGSIQKYSKVFSTATKENYKRALIKINGEYKETPTLYNIYKIKLSEDANVEAIAQSLSKEQDIEYAEPNYYLNIGNTITNDPLSTQQWHLGSSGANAQAAWDITHGDSTQVIAIIDTGVDWLHPDLSSNIWSNTDEIPGNGYDDDGNGFVDDVRGWDFINNDNNPADDNCHGTHVAGIAAAKGNNNIGIVGIAWGSKIMPIKVLQSSGYGTSSDIAEGVEYATENGATVLNLSLGGYSESYTLKQALEVAYSTTMIIAAAGNDSYCICNDCNICRSFFPACYSWIIGVQALAANMEMAEFSNKDLSGPTISGHPDGFNYEISAPGVNIYSTFPNGGYANLSGTSMAAPIVAGCTALMKSHYPGISNEEIFTRIIQGSPNNNINLNSCLTVQPVSDLQFQGFSFNDTIANDDHDHIIDAGETIQMYLSVKNFGGIAYSVTTRLQFGPFEDTTVATIVNNTSNLGNLSNYASLTGQTNPFIIYIHPNVAHDRDIVFKYLIFGNNTDTISGTFFINVQNGFELAGIMDSTLILWPDHFYLINNSFRVDVNGHLIIKPGVHIKVNQAFDLKGQITAVGTKDSLIIVDGPYWTWPPLSQNSVIYKYVNFTNITGNIYAHKLEYCIIENWNNGDMWYNDTIINCQIINISSLNLWVPRVLIKNNFSVITGTGANPLFNTLSYGSKSYNNFCNTNSSISMLLFNSYCSSQNSFFNNFVLNDPNTRVIGLGSGSCSFVDFIDQYWGTTDSLKIRSKIHDFWNNPYFPICNFQPFLTQPSVSAHGIVWKVELDGVDAQDGQQEPIGVGLHEFKVYFNRAMNIAYTPFLTFGVIEPFTQKLVNQNPSWNADSTIWTAYYTVTEKTGDGMNTIRVTNARDDEDFEIPEESYRFKFNLQAASAQSLEFTATAGIGKVYLEWPQAGFDDAMGFNMYRYYNITDSTFSPPVMINTQLITDTFYHDLQVIPDTTYHYLFRVVSTDLVETDFSKTVTAVPFNAAEGDANGDLSINVLDITSVVSNILNQNPLPFLQNAADANNDGSINVLDIISIINMMLGNKCVAVSDYSSVQNIDIRNNTILVQSSGTISALQFQLIGSSPDIKLIPILEGFELSYAIKNDTLTGILYSFTERQIPDGITEIIRIEPKQATLVWGDILGGNACAAPVRFKTGINENPDAGKVILSCFPNPFSNCTVITYKLPFPANITIDIYDMVGRKIKFFGQKDHKVGEYQISWDGKNSEGTRLPEGLYYGKMTAKNKLNNDVVCKTTPILIVR